MIMLILSASLGHKRTQQTSPNQSPLICKWRAEKE